MSICECCKMSLAPTKLPEQETAELYFNRQVEDIKRQRSIYDCKIQDTVWLRENRGKFAFIKDGEVCVAISEKEAFDKAQIFNKVACLVKKIGIESHQLGQYDNDDALACIKISIESSEHPLYDEVIEYICKGLWKLIEKSKKEEQEHYYPEDLHEILKEGINTKHGWLPITNTSIDMIIEAENKYYTNLMKIQKAMNNFS